MNDFLSAAEIDALFDQASSGRPPAESPDNGQGRRTRWLRTVDFSRPSKFGIDQQRRLRRVMDVFCASAATRLSAEHRLDVELEVIDAGQFTFANALESVPESSVAAVVETAGSETKMIMTAELILVLEVIERLLGGTGDTVSERALTDIERVLARRLFGAFVECLSATWYDVCAESLELGRIDPLGEGPQIVPGSEPALVITVEARLARRSTTLALIVPWVDGGAPSRPPSPAPTRRAGLSDDPRAAAARARRAARGRCRPARRGRPDPPRPRRRARAASRRRGQARRDGRRRHGRLRRRRARPPRPRRALGRPPRDPDPRALTGRRRDERRRADGAGFAWASPPRRRSSAPCRTPLPAPRASAPSSPVTAPSRPASRPSTASPCPRCAPRSPTSTASPAATSSCSPSRARGGSPPP